MGKKLVILSIFLHGIPDVKMKAKKGINSPGKLKRANILWN